MGHPLYIGVKFNNETFHSHVDRRIAADFAPASLRRPTTKWPLVTAEAPTFKATQTTAKAT